MSAADDDLAALHHQVSLASSAALSASDHDLAFHLQLSEAIHASLLLQQPSNAAIPSRPAPPLPEEPSDASCALAVHAADLTRAEQDRRDAQACRAYHARAAASVRVAARDLAAIPEDRWAHDGDYFERPLEGGGALFRVLFKGMASREVVGPRDRDPGVGVLAVAICGPRGEVVLRIHKPVQAQAQQGRMTLEAMALVEGLNAALGLGIRTLNVLTDNKPLHNHMSGIWRPRQKRLVDMINEALSAKRKFEQCEILCFARTQVNYVTKLATDSLQTQIAKAAAVSAGKEKRENCTICLEDTDVSKIHAVEGCAQRFCFSCMKEHVKVKLLHGMLPACPQDGWTTKLTVEGSKMFLSPRLLAIMVQRIREAQIPPTHKIYCPYPKCSALMSMRELIHPMQASSSKYTLVDAATLRKCVKCSGSFCISCKVPWHHQMTCYDYKRRCGYEFCYTCGKEWKEKKATCSCPLWDERNIIRDDPQGNAGIHDDPEDEYDDYYDEDENNYYVGEGHQYNVDYHRQYDGGDRHHGHFYQYNR
uniref:RBR-type E3 ubiquitin transferase n=1 Tax=Oryza meridionalis TaxID=40149 RepID=A0A0E0EY22_9ORYZ